MRVLQWVIDRNDELCSEGGGTISHLFTSEDNSSFITSPGRERGMRKTTLSIRSIPFFGPPLVSK